MRDIPFVWKPITDPVRMTDIVAHYDVQTQKAKIMGVYSSMNLKRLQVLYKMEMLDFTRFNGQIRNWKKVGLTPGNSNNIQVPSKSQLHILRIVID